MISKIAAAAAMIAACTAVAATTPASARSRGHRYQAPPAYERDAMYDGQEREPFSFYPQDIKGGVRGNLPFNNQIRKFTDPLNAFGAGG